ncbi:MAG: hypothetical protein IT162_06390 [Bryobacterales bacterium]|nr:hypothetical protein [Bryobacterales bacterium]
MSSAAAVTDWSASRLTYEYDYRTGQPRHHVAVDSSGFAIQLEEDGQFRRDPLRQAQLAMQHFHAALASGSEEEADEQHDAFAATSEALLRELRPATLDGKPALVGLSYRRLAAYAGHSTPWISARTQAAVIGVLCRMYQNSRRETLLECARAALTPFLTPVRQGGLASEVPGCGVTWFEEFPFPGATHHGLSCHLTALFAIHELMRVSGGDTAASRLFHDGAAGLARAGGVLGLFDTGYWSRGDLRPVHGLTPESLEAHARQTRQLRVLGQITGDARLARVAARWAGYSRNPLCRLRADASVLAWRATQARAEWRDWARGWSGDAPPAPDHHVAAAAPRPKAG